jgi:hypothetical protein
MILMPLLDHQFGGTRYHARVVEQLALALSAADDEYAALAADDGSGLVLYGPVAGAVSVVKIHLLAGDCRLLQDRLVAREWEKGTRLIVCEVADDAPFAAARQSLTSGGFVCDARVPDFFAPAIALEVFALRR